jgi:hypothetical protein
MQVDMVINPITYAEVLEFLKNDDTHTLKHSSLFEMDEEFLCLDFAITFKEKANAKGIKCAIVFIHREDAFWGNVLEGDHSMNAIQTSDKGIVFVEPQQAMIVKELKVGDNLALALHEAWERNNPLYDRYANDQMNSSIINANRIVELRVMW